MGHMVRRTVQAYLNDLCPNLRGKRILILGYGVPYVHLWMKEAQVYAAMLAKMGATHWPENGENRSCLVWESSLPFCDETFDLILIAHGLEFADDDTKMLQESRRILKNDGHIVTITPNRRGAWCRREVSPLSRGRPYSAGQMERTLQKADLMANSTTYALFTPPSELSWIQQKSPWFEKFGRQIYTPLGGVIIHDIQKDMYSCTVVRSTNHPLAVRKLGVIGN